MTEDLTNLIVTVYSTGQLKLLTLRSRKTVETILEWAEQIADRVFGVKVTRLGTRRDSLRI